jgi:hypothetical protein
MWLTTILTINFEGKDNSNRVYIDKVRRGGTAMKLLMPSHKGLEGVA